MTKGLRSGRETEKVRYLPKLSGSRELVDVLPWHDKLIPHL